MQINPSEATTIEARLFQEVNNLVMFRNRSFRKRPQQIQDSCSIFHCPGGQFANDEGMT